MLVCFNLSYRTLNLKTYWSFHLLFSSCINDLVSSGRDWGNEIWTYRDVFWKNELIPTSQPRRELIFAVHETLFFFHFWLFLGRYLKNKKTFKASTVKITTFFSHGAGVVTFGQKCVTFPAAFCDIWISFWQKISNFRTVFLQTDKKWCFRPCFWQR